MSGGSQTPDKYERSDWSIGGVFGFIGFLCFSMLASAVGTYAVHKLFLRYDKPPTVEISPLDNMHREPPVPRLQVDDAADMADFRQAEDAILNSYGWVDPQTNRVRLPIDRAMDVLLQQGLPVRKNGSNS